MNAPCPSTVGGSPCLLPDGHNGSHRVREQAQDGTCSLCSGPCVRGESGAWWHVVGSCWGQQPWHAAPVFVPAPSPPVPSALGDKDNARD